MAAPRNSDTWNEWRNHVLVEIERLHTAQNEMKEDLSDIKQEIATLKVKAGVWGAVAGAIPAIVIFMMKFI